MKAVIYLRVSTKEQARVGEGKEGYSIPAQREACVKLLQEQGWELADEFVDAGFTATSLKRPALQRMMAAIKEDREIKFVVVHKIDRLARQVEGHVAITGVLKKLGVRLVSVTERLEESASGRLLEMLHAALAEFYSANLSVEVKKGMLQRVKQGGYAGRLPVGYRAERLFEDGHRISRAVIDEDRARFVKLAYTLYASGNYTIAELRDTLTDDGFEVEYIYGQRKPVSLNGLIRLLTSRFYIGEVKYEGIWYKGRHEPIISRDLFARAQEVYELHHATIGSRTRKHTHFLKGKLYCSCGARLSYTLAKGQQYPYFYCLAQKRPDATCREPYAKVADIEREVEEWYSSAQLSAEFADRLRDEIDAQILAKEATSVEERKWLNRQMTRLNSESQKSLDALYAGAISMESLKVEQQRITSEMEAVEVRLRRVRLGLEFVRTTGEAAIKLGESCGDAYRKVSVPRKKEINGTFIERFVVESGRVSRVEPTRLFKEILSRSSNSTTLVGDGGFEPPTSALSERRSNRLS
jgi:site-specific DNA recombinase